MQRGSHDVDLNFSSQPTSQWSGSSMRVAFRRQSHRPTTGSDI